MKVCSTIATLKDQIRIAKLEGKSIGFVPTMGALHKGHLSLIVEAQKRCDFVVLSIYVNPTQFNNPEDLIHYPRTLEADLKLLEETSCNCVFVPSTDEMYPVDIKPLTVDIGELGEVMEGRFRPGHFAGVMTIVKRLFDLVAADKAFFGLKDFQQVAVIRFLAKHFELPTEIIACPILREDNGLAMSSRNMRLTNDQKTEALVIYRSLCLAKEMAKSKSPSTIKQEMVALIAGSTLQLEYIEIVDPVTLQPLENTWVSGATACVVAFCGQVRLLDNMQLID